MPLHFQEGVLLTFVNNVCWQLPCSSELMSGGNPITNRNRPMNLFNGDTVIDLRA